MENTRPWRSIQALGKEQPGYIEAVLDEVRRRGPLTISDLEDGGGPTGALWGWKKGKVALEWLFDTGRITSAGRRNGFSRVYDLTERVIPPTLLDAPHDHLGQYVAELLLKSGDAEMPRVARSHKPGLLVSIAEKVAVVGLPFRIIAHGVYQQLAVQQLIV